MANYWVVSSKHSRDEDAERWNSKWTADGFLRAKRFYPSLRKNAEKDRAGDLVVNFDVMLYQISFQ